MLNFDLLRGAMVKEQLEARGLRNPRLLDAFRNVPRHRFVPESLQKEAYGDYPLSIGLAQTISQPYMAALMTDYLGIKDADKVLEIGTGSGYQSAILSRMGAKVYTVEYLEGLSKSAQILLKSLKYVNISFHVGDGTLGWEEFAPFEKIIVTAAGPEIPPPLIEQLARGGRMIMPKGDTGYSQRLTLIDKINNTIVTTDREYCVFVALKGKYGIE